MARKRKTLPKDFADLLATGDLDALQKVYERCEIDAHDRNSKATALSFNNCPAGLTRWLVAQGLDVDTPDAWGNTPLSQKAGRDLDIRLLIELGANVNATDNSGFTPLHDAIPRSPRNVQILLDHGADMWAADSRGRTPLQAALEQCTNAAITDVARSARILLDAGSPVPDNAAEQVTRIAKQFQPILDRWGPEHHGDTIGALADLHAMFGVTPVAARPIHDGIAPIAVTATDWPAQFDELWDYLVPAAGAAATVQGEVIRLAGRICHELLDNGGINWNRDYARMKHDLIAYFGTGTPVSSTEELAGLSTRIRRDIVDDHALNRISELAVSWVLANADPVPVAPPRSGRR